MINNEEDVPFKILQRKMYIKNKIIEANKRFYKENKFYKEQSTISTLKKRVRFNV
jgi:hypothetical protein